MESIDLIEKYSKNKIKTDFLDSAQLQDSIIRRIEIIGEAAKNIPDDIKRKHPETISGMRDVLIHAYFGIDLDLTWQVITDNIPELKKNILKLKTELR